MNTVLVFFQADNKPGRRDATGAFVPEARAFAQFYRGSTTAVVSRGITTTTPDDVKRKQVIDTISAHKNVSVVAFFGHGGKSSLPSFGGFRHKAHRRALCEALDGAMVQDGGNVFLFACLAGNELAKSISEAIPRILVMGHLTSGHTTRNPFKIVYRGGMVVFDARLDLVGPHTPRFTLWRDSLRRDPSVRFSMPVGSPLMNGGWARPRGRRGRVCDWHACPSRYRRAGYRPLGLTTG